MKVNALFCSAVGCCIAFAAVGAADVALVEDGAAKCCIVVADDAHPALKFGAREIAKYLGVATGAKVEVSAAAAKAMQQPTAEQNRVFAFIQVFPFACYARILPKHDHPRQSVRKYR